MSRHLLAITAFLAFASPAFAQSGAPVPTPEQAAHSFTIGGGVAYIPDYVGSNDYRVIPAAAVRGRVGPVSIVSRATYLYVDLFPRGSQKIDFDFGPVGGVRLNRTGHIDDPVVSLLPKLNTAYEAGGFIGLSLHDLTNPYDTLAFRLDAIHDFGSAHESTIISPNVEFSTPLSRFTYVNLSAGLDFVENRFADYYFGITPSDSLASGLPVFNPDGGLEKWKATLIVNQSITGELTHGLSVFGLVDYTQLTGDFKRSPIVSQRGTPDQWLLAAGLAYTF